VVEEDLTPGGRRYHPHCTWSAHIQRASNSSGAHPDPRASESACRAFPEGIPHPTACGRWILTETSRRGSAGTKCAQSFSTTGLLRFREKVRARRRSSPDPRGHHAITSSKEWTRMAELALALGSRPGGLRPYRADKGDEKYVRRVGSACGRRSKCRDLMDNKCGHPLLYAEHAHGQARGICQPGRDGLDAAWNSNLRTTTDGRRPRVISESIRPDLHWILATARRGRMLMPRAAARLCELPGRIWLMDPWRVSIWRDITLRRESTGGFKDPGSRAEWQLRGDAGRTRFPGC